MKRAGKKTIAWDAERAKLKVRFLSMGITSCELKYQGCWRDNALGFAHSKKRNDIQKPHELSEVCLACSPCHQKIELLPKKEMAKVVRDIIHARRKHQSSQF